MTTEFIIAIGGLIAGVTALISTTIKAAKERNHSRDSEYEHSENLVKLVEGNQQTENSLNKINEKLIVLTESQTRFNLMVLRGEIMNIYWQYEKEKRIPESQYQTVLGFFDVYESMGGNGYAKEHVEKIKQWQRF